MPPGTQVGVYCGGVCQRRPFHEGGPPAAAGSDADAAASPFAVVAASSSRQSEHDESAGSIHISLPLLLAAATCAAAGCAADCQHQQGTQLQAKGASRIHIESSFDPAENSDMYKKCYKSIKTRQLIASRRGPRRPAAAARGTFARVGTARRAAGPQAPAAGSATACCSLQRSPSQA